MICYEDRVGWGGGGGSKIRMLLYIHPKIQAIICESLLESVAAESGEITETKWRNNLENEG